MDSNSLVTYGFRFSSSGQLVHLSQREIDLIPYLSVLVRHQNGFMSIENANGEYVLNEPMQYSPLVSILRSIGSQNPYRLLDELPEDENVFEMIQLYDYVGLPSFPLPLLRYPNLIRSKSVKNEEKDGKIGYHEASLPEVHRTAGEFLIGVAKNEYKLSDQKTIDRIFNLLNIIVFNGDVFNVRFRVHTLTIAKKCCYSFLSKKQRHQLEISHRLPQYVKINSNQFCWKMILIPIEKDLITHVFLIHGLVTMD